MVSRIAQAMSLMRCACLIVIGLPFLYGCQNKHDIRRIAGNTPLLLVLSGKPLCRPQDPGFVTVSLANRSGKPLWFLKHGTPFGHLNDDIFKVTTESSCYKDRVAFKESKLGHIYTGLVPNSSAGDQHIYIPPGKSVAVSVSMCKAYDLSCPDVYCMMYEGKILYTLSLDVLRSRRYADYEVAKVRAGTSVVVVPPENSIRGEK